MIKNYAVILAFLLFIGHAPQAIALPAMKHPSTGVKMPKMPCSTMIPRKKTVLITALTVAGLYTVIKGLFFTLRIHLDQYLSFDQFLTLQVYLDLKKTITAELLQENSNQLMHLDNTWELTSSDELTVTSPKSSLGRSFDPNNYFIQRTSKKFFEFLNLLHHKPNLTTKTVLRTPEDQDQIIFNAAKTYVLENLFGPDGKLTIKSDEYLSTALRNIDQQIIYSHTQTPIDPDLKFAYKKMFLIETPNNPEKFTGNNWAGIIQKYAVEKYNRSINDPAFRRRMILKYINHNTSFPVIRCDSGHSSYYKH